jgi:pyruvate dehydrogenase E1 component beta subunit
MPATPADARDLLIAAVQCPDPVLYIDDRWLYEWEEEIAPPSDQTLAEIGPRLLREGTDLTLAAAGYSVRLALDAAELLVENGVSCDVVDQRVVNPFSPEVTRQSVRKTGRLIAIDGSWSNCGFAAEMIAAVVESVEPAALRGAPARITLPAAPAPTSQPLEAVYYPSAQLIADRAYRMVTGNARLPRAEHAQKR